MPISALSALLLALSQPACERLRKVEGASPKAAGEEAAQAGRASLFTVSADQQSHLKVAPAARVKWFTTIHTTGTVDWDNDHTTQAITQVERPDHAHRRRHGLAREGRRSAALRGERRRRQRRFPTTGRRTTAWTWRSGRSTAARICWRTRRLRSATSRPRRPTSTTPRPISRRRSKTLRIFGVTPDDLKAAETQDMAIRPELPMRAPDRRHRRAEAGAARAAHSGRFRPRLRHQRHVDGVGAGPRLREGSAVGAPRRQGRAAHARVPGDLPRHESRTSAI